MVGWRWCILSKQEDHADDRQRAAGVPETGLLDAVQARLANAVSAEPDWITHCETCSVLYEGTLDVCPENVRHRVRTLDANSSAFRAYVAGRRGSITDTDI